MPSEPGGEGGRIPADALRVLRIGVTDWILGDDFAGTREILGDMARRLERLDLVVYSPRKNRRRTTSFGERFTVHPTDSRSKLHFFPDAARLAGRLVREQHHHLIETLDPMGSGLVGYRLARRFGVPWLAICHSDYFSSPAWRRLSPRYALLDRWLATLLLPHADHVRAYSESVRSGVLALGVRPERVTVLPLPMRTHLFSPGADELERYARRSVLFVGRLDPQKGLPTLLRAWRLLLDRGAPARLTLVGSGPEARRLEALVGELGLGSTVELAGFLRHDELAARYRQSSLFVLPSLHEAFGQVIVEAGLCGLATVATNVGGIPESVVPEETGLLVPPGDPAELSTAISRCLDEPETARRMGREAARRYRERWSYQRTMERYVEMLAKVASRGRQPLRRR